MKTEPPILSPGKCELSSNVPRVKTCFLELRSKNFFPVPSAFNRHNTNVEHLLGAHRPRLRVKSPRKLLRPDLLNQFGPASKQQDFGKQQSCSFLLLMLLSLTLFNSGLF